RIARAERRRGRAQALLLRYCPGGPPVRARVADETDPGLADRVRNGLPVSDGDRPREGAGRLRLRRERPAGDRSRQRDPAHAAAASVTRELLRRGAGRRGGPPPPPALLPRGFAR